MMKKLWILSILACGIIGAACNSGDPAPTTGDAEVTKGMAPSQENAASSKAREAGGGSTPGALTPPPP